MESDAQTSYPALAGVRVAGCGLHYVRPREQMSSTHYDPDNAPDPKEWLALDEHERIRLAKNYHVARRIKLPDAKAHAIFHAIVENQIAEGFGPSCRAVERLRGEGLTRHDAIHAIASVVANSLFESQKNPTAMTEPERQRFLNQAIEALSATSWRQRS